MGVDEDLDQNLDLEPHWIAVHAQFKSEFTHLCKVPKSHDWSTSLQVKQQAHMGLVARKPVFGVSDKVSFKPDSSATETR